MKRKVLTMLLAVTMSATVGSPVCAADFTSGAESVAEFSESFVDSEDISENTADTGTVSEEADAEEETEEFTVPEGDTVENTDPALNTNDTYDEEDDETKIEILHAPDKTEYMCGIEARQASDFDLSGLKVRFTYYDGETEVLTPSMNDERFLEDSDGRMYECSIWNENTELEWDEYGEANTPLAVGKYTLRIENRYSENISTSVKFTVVPISDVLTGLIAESDGKYSGITSVSGKYACAKFVPGESGTYTFTSDTPDFDWGNGYRFNLYDASYTPVSRVTSDNQSGMGMSKYKLEKGTTYYLSYKFYKTDKVTSLNYKVELVHRVESIELVEEPYSNIYYVWGNSGITWESGKYRLYDKYGGKVKVTYNNGETEIIPIYAENKYGEALISYIKYSGKGGYGTYDLYFNYEGSEISVKIPKGAVIKKASDAPTLKGSGTIKTSVSKQSEGSAYANSFRFITGSDTRYAISATPLTFMTFVYEVSDGKTQWAGTLGGGKGVKVLKPNSVYYIAAQGSDMNVDTETFTIKPQSAKLTSCTVTLSDTFFSYTGKNIEPAVTVADGNSYLTAGTDYTISYSNNKNPGTASVIIKGKGSYTGTVKKTFKIKIADCTLKSVKKSGTSNIQIDWSRAVGASGYYIYRSVSKNGKFSKIATVASGKTVRYIDQKATPGKTWYYKIVPYVKINGKAVNGSGSRVLSVYLKVTLTLNQKQITLYLSSPKSVQLTAKTTGTTSKVTWKSSNTAIASVSSNGKVTPKKKGSCIITATVNGVTAKCKVTVEESITGYPKNVQKLITYLKTNGYKWNGGGDNYESVWRISDTEIVTFQYQSPYEDQKSSVWMRYEINPQDYAKQQSVMISWNGYVFENSEETRRIVASYFLNGNNERIGGNIPFDYDGKEDTTSFSNHSTVSFNLWSNKNYTLSQLSTKGNKQLHKALPLFNTYLKQLTGLTMSDLGFANYKF